MCVYSLVIDREHTDLMRLWYQLAAKAAVSEGETGQKYSQALGW